MEIKEACLYVGIILLACGAAVWLFLLKNKDLVILFGGYEIKV